MTSNTMSTDSVSLERERLLEYKLFAVAFSYPDDNFFTFFPQLSLEKERFILDYDRYFRANELWLYTTEYLAENEFERAGQLSDIMGFYRAFGLEPERQRPDFLSTEFEFMHYLIFKMIYALDKHSENMQEKISLCLDAQRKFFAVHLYPAAMEITQKIISQLPDHFYSEIAQDLQEFLVSEKQYLSR